MDAAMSAIVDVAVASGFYRERYFDGWRWARIGIERGMTRAEVESWACLTGTSLFERGFNDACRVALGH